MLMIDIIDNNIVCMEIQGIIKHVLPVREGVSQNGSWKTASYVIETEERYPRRMVFDVRDGRDGRIARLNIQEGKRMSISFDIDAHEYQSRWFNEITAWGAKDLGNSTSETQNMNQQGNIPAAGSLEHSPTADAVEIPFHP